MKSLVRFAVAVTFISMIGAQSLQAASCSATCTGGTPVSCSGDTCSATNDEGVTCTSRESCGTGCTYTEITEKNCVASSPDDGPGGVKNRTE